MCGGGIICLMPRRSRDLWVGEETGTEGNKGYDKIGLDRVGLDRTS